MLPGCETNRIISKLPFTWWRLVDEGLRLFIYFIFSWASFGLGVGWKLELSPLPHSLNSKHVTSPHYCKGTLVIFPKMTLFLKTDDLCKLLTLPPVMHVQYISIFFKIMFLFRSRWDYGSNGCSCLKGNTDYEVIT